MPVRHRESSLIIHEPYDNVQTFFCLGGLSVTEIYPKNLNNSLSCLHSICDPGGTIIGFMPHPERAIYSWYDQEEGPKIFRSGVDGVT